MSSSTFTNTTLAVSLAFTLVGCGSSDDDAVETTTEESTAAVEDPEVSDDQPVAGITITDGGDDIDLTDDTARVITSACGTLPISDVPASSTQASANSFIEGQLVRGQIQRNEVEENFWTIDLPVGYYHFIYDNRRGDETAGMFGLQTDLFDASGAFFARVGLNTGFRYRQRGGTLFFNDAPRTFSVQLKRAGGVVTGSPQDYIMGIFANGRSIPSPFFDDCPTITPISVDTTTALTLPISEQASDTLTYEIELEQGEYTLASQASKIESSSGTSRYSLKLLDGFGIGYPGSEIAGASVGGGEVSASDESQFTVENSGRYWINIEQERGFSDLDLEFTVSPVDN